LLLIDDVFTTGSTMLECAKTLKQNGAGKITIATLAVTAS
jgi:predicted amidophosphoribosyltransferase